MDGAELSTAPWPVRDAMLRPRVDYAPRTLVGNWHERRFPGNGIIPYASSNSPFASSASSAAMIPLPMLPPSVSRADYVPPPPALVAAAVADAARARGSSFLAYQVRRPLRRVVAVLRSCPRVLSPNR